MFQKPIELLAQLVLIRDLLYCVLVLEYPFVNPCLRDGLVQLTRILFERCFLDHKDSCTLGIFLHGDLVPACSFSLALNVAGAQGQHVLTVPHDLYQQVLVQAMELVPCPFRLKN